MRASGGHLEASGDTEDTEDAARGHPGGTQEAPRRHPEAPKAPRRLQEAKSDTPLS